MHRRIENRGLSDTQIFEASQQVPRPILDQLDRQTGIALGLYQPKKLAIYSLRDGVVEKAGGVKVKRHPGCP